MTNFQAVEEAIRPYKVEAGAINKALEECEVMPGGKYSPATQQQTARAAIYVLEQMLVLASESRGYSRGYDAKMLEYRIHLLAKDNGLTAIAEEFNRRPTIEFL